MAKGFKSNPLQTCELIHSCAPDILYCVDWLSSWMILNSRLWSSIFRPEYTKYTKGRGKQKLALYPENTRP